MQLLEVVQSTLSIIKIHSQVIYPFSYEDRFMIISERMKDGISLADSQESCLILDHFIRIQDDNRDPMPQPDR